MVLDPSMGPPGSFGHVRLLLGPTFAQPLDLSTAILPFDALAAVAGVAHMPINVHDVILRASMARWKRSKNQSNSSGE